MGVAITRKRLPIYSEQISSIGQAMKNNLLYEQMHLQVHSHSQNTYKSMARH